MALLCQGVLLLTGTVLMVVLTANVVARYVLATGGFDWAEEVPQQVFPWFIMAGVALAVQHGGHVAVEWLLGKLGREGKRLVLLAGHALVVAGLRRAVLAGAGGGRHRRHRAQPRPRPAGELRLLGDRRRLRAARPRHRDHRGPPRAASAPRPCRSRAPRRCRHEPRPDRRLRRADGRGDPGGARPGHRLRRRAALGRAAAAAAGGAADVRADPVLPDAGAALLHPGRHPDHGGQAGRGAAALLRRDHAAAARRRALHHRGRLGGVRRRLRQRGGQRQRARLGADPLAEAPGLPGGAVRGEQRDLGGDRHPDPALDPDDPLRRGQRRLASATCSWPACCPASSWPAGFVGVCWWQGRRLGMAADTAAARPAPPRPARRAGAAGAGPAGADPGRAPLRLRHADRDRGDGGALRAR